MTDMETQVAHAMSGVIDWGEVTPARREHFRSLARIAIPALREPTDAMILAAEEAVPALASFANKADSPSFKAWQVMIDSALAEEGRP